ncbi:MAG: hypothetical protein ACLUB2_04745 [Butyricicoccus pullicaecorum]
MTASSSEQAEALAAQLIQEVQAGVSPDQRDTVLGTARAHGAALYVSDSASSAAAVTAVMGRALPLPCRRLIWSSTSDPGHLPHSPVFCCPACRTSEYHSGTDGQAHHPAAWLAGVAWLWLAVLLDTLATVLCLQNTARSDPKN